MASSGRVDVYISIISNKMSNGGGEYQWGRTENIEVLVKTTEAESRAGPGQSNFTNIAVRPPIEAAGRNDEIYCHLTGFNIPYSWYNTDDDNNKVLTQMRIKRGATIETHTENFVLDEANYTILSLANALQTKINEALKNAANFPLLKQTNNVCTISYSTDTNKLNFNLNWALFVVQLQDIITVTFLFGTGVQQANRQLGFNKGDGYFFRGENAVPIDLQSRYQCNMFVSNYILIHSNFLTSNATTSEQSTAEGSSDILAMVPIMTPPFTFLTLDKTSTNVSHTRVRQKTISNISIKITDENNRELDFNGSQWNVGLAFEIVTEAGQRGHMAGKHIELRSRDSSTNDSTKQRKRKK